MKQILNAPKQPMLIIGLKKSSNFDKIVAIIESKLYKLLKEKTEILEKSKDDDKNKKELQQEETDINSVSNN